MAKLGVCKSCRGKVSDEARTCPHCGQPDPYDEQWSASLRPFLDRGDLIGAIKLVREITGWGLKEAKDFVDGMR